MEGKLVDVKGVKDASVLKCFGIIKRNCKEVKCVKSTKNTDKNSEYFILGFVGCTPHKDSRGDYASYNQHKVQYVPEVEYVYFKKAFGFNLGKELNHKISHKNLLKCVWWVCVLISSDI